jgi:TRAP-type C4-dicarboxylate transport system permease small subunit
MEPLRRIDRAWARAEGWLTVTVLILMVLVAGFQALVRNLTRFDIQWANELLTDMEWADSLLRKGTLWLAFLGASLATHKHKHIGIDILVRFAPTKMKYGMLAVSGILAGLISLGLTVSFSDAVKLNLTERPIEYEMLGDEGSMHVCDASDEELAQLEDFERPTGFCLLRGGLGLLGIPAETPGAAFQLIVPLMLFAVALRLLLYGIGYGRVLLSGPEAMARAEAEEQARSDAQRQSVAAPPRGDESDAPAGDSE